MEKIGEREALVPLKIEAIPFKDKGYECCAGI